MARLYIATPHTAAGALTEVATGTALKTLVQVGVPANTPINVWGWGCSFKGISGTDAPGELYLMSSAAIAATVTSLTPDPWQFPTDVASICVGGAALTGHTASAEGTIVASVIHDAQLVHPQTGYSVWFPQDARPRIGKSTAELLRIRALFAVGINAVPWVVWDE